MINKEHDAIGFGALNVDQLFWVKQVLVDGETVVEKESLSPGGSAANTIAALAELGLRTAYIGVVGANHEAKILLDDFRKRGVDICFISVKPGVSGLVLGIEDPRGNRAHYIRPGVNNELSEDDLPPPKEISTQFLHFSSFVNRQQLDLQIRLISQINRDIKISVAPGMVYAQLGYERINPLLGACHYIFMTRQELGVLLGQKGLSSAQTLLNQTTEAVVLTAGERGCYLVTHEGKEFLPSIEVKGKVFPTGAGDAFAAGFLYGQYQGLSLRESALAGNLLASFCVQKMGAREGYPTKEEFDRRLEMVT